MGRGSKIKHIEKNSFSKFKQVLVKKEDKEKSNNKEPGTSKKPETSKESDRPVEHEIPQKTDGQEKSETTAEAQVKSQELPETSKMLETRKEQGPDRSQKSERPDTTVEKESFKKPDKHDKPHRAEELQVQSLKKLDTSKKYQSPKKRGGKLEKPDISQKSESTLKPDEHDRSKTPDKLTIPQWPKGPQIQSQERPESPKESERPQTSECVDRPFEHEIPQKADKLEKSETTAEPQVKSQERLETSKMLETRNEQEPDIPQISESSFITVEKKRSKKHDKHDKPQRAEGLQVQSLKKPDTSKRYESPKRRGGKLEKPYISQKSESTLKPDEHDRSMTPDKLTIPQWPKGPQIKSQERPESPKESERPQTSECVDRPFEHEIPQKAEKLEKSEATAEPQVKSQERLETSKMLETRNEQEPDIPQKSESSFITVEKKRSKKHDKHDKPQRAEGLQVQSLKRPDTSKRYESPKRRGGKLEKPYISQKSESTLKLDEHDNAPDKLTTPEWPRGPQIKSHERSETPKGQTGKPEGPERPQKSESPDTRDNLEWPKKSDRIDKPKFPEKPQVKNQENFEMHKHGHKEKTESLERPQISESTHNRFNEHKRPWKPDTLDKHQRLVGSQEGLGTSKRSETPNGQNGEARRHERPQKSDSPNIPDKQESSKKPDRLDESERPEGLQKAKSPDLSEKVEKPERQEKSESSVKLEVQESINLEKVPAEKEIKHPLEHTWGMWLITNDKRNWEDNLVKLTSFSTVEDYWCLYHHMKPPSELDRGKDYAVFKNEFRPMWEDPANRNGGRWLINFDKKRNEVSDLDSIWMFVVLLVIGENFRVSDAICGAVVSVRAKSRIALWVSSYKNENAVKDVGHTLRNTLGLRGRLSFQQHNTNTSLLNL